jgi:hypothetical protein
VISDRIKAWIALFGGVLTALLGLDIIPTGSWRVGMTIAVVVITAILTYATPNAGYVKLPPA